MTIKKVQKENEESKKEIERLKKSGEDEKIAALESSLKQILNTLKVLKV